MKTLLDIKDLRVNVAGEEILRGVSLQMKAGEIHAVMGPNGSGKSTLSYVLAGHPRYELLGGNMRLDGKSLNALAPEKRAQAGLGLALQYPTKLAGVSMINFLKTALTAQRKARKQKPLTPAEVLAHIRACAKHLDIDDTALRRGVNDGFSGGEAKRNELLQLLVLAPKVSVFDEIDSGLDIDALKLVALAMQQLHSKQHAQLIITHYPRLLEYVRPDYVHILVRGKIRATGGAELAQEVEQNGYAAYGEEAQ